MPRYYEAETIAGLIKAYTMGDEFKRMAMLESLSNSQTADVVEKERYDRLLEDATIMAEALNEYQTADEVERT